MSEPASDSLTFAFADSAAERYGLIRLGTGRAPGGAPQGSALALLFAGREPVAAHARGGLEVPAGATWEAIALAGVAVTTDAPGERWTVRFDAGDGQGAELVFEALGEPAALDAEAVRLGGMDAHDQPCRVRGTVRAGVSEVRVDALGQCTRAWGDPDWDRIELTRSVAAWTGGPAASLTAIRPAGARHHADEAVSAALWEPGTRVAIEEGRLSTTYDADGHARRAGLELWPAGDGDDAWARRAAGEVLCGSSLELGVLRLDCAFFRWHLEGRAGVGRYDILRRAA